MVEMFEVGPCESSYQMGFLIGQRFSKLIRSRLATDLILQQQLLPFAHTPESQSLIRALSSTNSDKFPNYWDELVGTAAGSGVPLLNIILLNFRKELLPFLPKMAAIIPNADEPDDCSDVLVVSDSMAIAAHNEDANVALIGHTYLIKATLSNGPSFTAYTYAGELPSCAFGFNSNGMAFTLNSVPPSKEEIMAGGIGRNFISRDLLEASSLDDALRFDMGYLMEEEAIVVPNLRNKIVSRKIFSELSFSLIPDTAVFIHLDGDGVVNIPQGVVKSDGAHVFPYQEPRLQGNRAGEGGYTRPSIATCMFDYLENCLLGYGHNKVEDEELCERKIVMIQKHRIGKTKYKSERYIWSSLVLNVQDWKRWLTWRERISIPETVCRYYERLLHWLQLDRGIIGFGDGKFLFGWYKEGFISRYLEAKARICNQVQDVSSLLELKLPVLQSGDRDKPKGLGEVVCKGGHMNYDSVHALQLGLRHFSGQYMALPSKELSSLDFRSTKSTWIRIPKHGLRRLPPGTVTEFEWKDYCPTVFRHLQELDSIDYADYMLSVCGHETLREISSPGKSGCLLYLSRDDRFIVKTLRKSEMKVLLEMLPNYYRHVKKYDSSLLTKFYGLHAVRPVGGIKVCFVVMRNLFQSELYIHKRFDLKGSSQGRTVGKVGLSESTTFKDLDLDFTFHLDPLTRHRLLTQIKYDCEFLEAEGIMDYSLLLGLHVEVPHRGGSFDGRDSAGKNFLPFDPSNKHMDPELTFADICDQAYRPGVKLGRRMVARAVRTPKRGGTSSVSSNLRAATREIYNVKLFIGVIDILQGYNMLKRIEHAYKSIQFDSRSISAVNPSAYSVRFQEFLCKVFPAGDPDFYVYNW